MRRTPIALAAGLLLAVPAPAQTVAGPGDAVSVTSDPSSARPADVESIDAIIAALYDVISGPAGQKRDWARLHSLFVRDARMMPYGAKGLRVGTVADYVARSGPLLEGGGFFEREIARSTDAYADIAHVYSTYEARKVPGGPLLVRGINSLQLVRHGGRWWIVSLMWQSETPAVPLPDRYLPKSGKTH